MKFSQTDLYSLLLSREVSWQALLYELIRTEQLDPWDIDLVKLASSYLKKVQELQAEGLFFISSKVLLAASLLLRLKSELLHESMQNIDSLLFQPEANDLIKTPKLTDSVELNEFQYELLPHTPLPRLKRVTLPELLKALEKAISTEQRRVRRITLSIKQEFELPKKRLSIGKLIKQLYKKIKEFFCRNPQRKLTYQELAGSKEQQVACFLPLLHLAHQNKVRLEQTIPFGPIEVWLNKI